MNSDVPSSLQRSLVINGCRKKKEHLWLCFPHDVLAKSAYQLLFDTSTIDAKNRIIVLRGVRLENVARSWNYKT